MTQNLETNPHTVSVTNAVEFQLDLTTYSFTLRLEYRSVSVPTNAMYRLLMVV